MSAAVINNLIMLLRSKEDDSFKLEINFVKKLMIINYIIKSGWDGWDFICRHYLGTVKKLILNEVIEYCKHQVDCSTKSDFNKSADQDPKSFAQVFNKLDEETIFDLISECIRYCYKSVIKGRGLCLEFNILVNTLTILATKRTVQANIRSTSMDYESMDTFQIELSGDQRLLDTLFSQKYAYQAKIDQEERENFTQQIYDLDQASDEDIEFEESNYLMQVRVLRMNRAEQRENQDLKPDPNNPELLDLGRCKEKTNKDSLKDVKGGKLDGERGNEDADLCVHNEGAYIGLKPCPNPELVACLDILGRCKVKTNNSSCKDFLKAVKSGKLEREEGIQDDAENCVLNEGACAGLKPCPGPKLVYCLDILGRGKEKNKLATYTPYVKWCKEKTEEPLICWLGKKSETMANMGYENEEEESYAVERAMPSLVEELVYERRRRLRSR